MRTILPALVLSLGLASCGQGKHPKLDDAAVREMVEKAKQAAQERAIEDLKPQFAALAVSVIKDRAAKIVKETGDPQDGEAYLREAARDLFEGMPKQDDPSRAMTAEMVRQLTGKKLGNTYEEWRKWFEETDPKTPEDRARALVRRLGSRTGDREAIYGELASLGEPALDALVEAVRTWNPNRRLDAAFALRKIRSSRAVPVLVDLVLNGPPEAWQPATAALVSEEDPGAYPLLISMLRDPQKRPRDVAVHILDGGQWKSAPGPENIPALVEAIARGDESSSRVAVNLLSRIPGPEAYNEVVAALSSPLSDVRRVAIANLGERAIRYTGERKAATESIIKALSSPDSTIRWGAVHAMGRLAVAFPEEQPSSIRWIVGCVKDEDDPDFVSYAGRVLEMFTGHTGRWLGKDPAALRELLGKQSGEGK